jgi:hypothetical protein
MIERTKSTVRVDQDAPWQFSTSRAQREGIGFGRYQFDCVFTHRETREERRVKVWLQDYTRDYFAAIREITNSRRDPAEFEGQELPTKGTEA